VKVRIPQPLLSYTERREEVEAQGGSVAAVLDDLDRQFPGIRFRMIDEQDRIRPHMKIFVNRDQIRRIDVPLADGDEVHIFQALSGG
jgi:molybdopterin synthase sulfur carrier subunit